MEPAHVRIKLNPSDWIQGNIFRTGGYEQISVERLFELLPSNGGIFFDIGANIGIYSLNMFRKAESVYAFEATETTYNHFKDTIDLNNIKNINLFLSAVHNKDNEIVKIYINDDSNVGGNSMYYGEILANQVKTIKIDTFVSEKNISRIDIIKIDVEGNELNVLEGAKESIKKFKPIIFCEINPKLNSDAGYKASNLFDCFTKELLYIANIWNGKKFKKINKREICSKQQNIYFFPRDINKRNNNETNPTS